MADLELTIEELNVSDPLRIILNAEHAPHGRRYEQVAWEETLEVKLGEEDGVRLPGRGGAIYPILYSKFQPRVFKGSLRDGLTGQLGGSQVAKNKIKRIADRAAGQRVSYGDDGFIGLLVLAKFGVEDPGNLSSESPRASDIVYELTFSVAEEDGFTAPERDRSSFEPRTLGDLEAMLRADAEVLKAQQLALAIKNTIWQAQLLQWNAVTDALDAAGDAIAIFQSGTVGQVQQARQAAQRTIGAAKAVQDKAGALADQLQALNASQVLDDLSAGSVAIFEANRNAILDEMLLMRDSMRSVSQAAQETLRQTTRLYQVRPGDTLDQVAQAALGQRGRAADLGITQAQLTARAGRYIRIPAG